MTTVITTVSAQNAKELCRIFEKFGGAFFLSKNSVLDYTAVSPDFLVFCTEDVQAIPSEKTVLLCDGSEKQLHLSAPCRFDRIVLYEPEQTEAQTENILSVGMSSHNAISIASSESNEMHISIQSVIKTLDGTQILPCEYSVILSEPFSSQTVLFAFAVLLLSGKTDAKSLKLRL